MRHRGSDPILAGYDRLGVGVFQVSVRAVVVADSWYPVGIQRQGYIRAHVANAVYRFDVPPGRIACRVFEVVGLPHGVLVQQC